MQKPLLMTTLAVMSIAAITSAPYLFATEPPKPDQQAIAETKPIPHYSQEQLDRIRQSLLSQIAVYDKTEKAMRSPTAAEANALAKKPAPRTATPIALPSGGVALRADLSQMSFLRAEIAESGSIKVEHSESIAANGSKSQQEGNHAH